MADRIYLDHAAATPIRRTVVEAMTAALHAAPGNPSAAHQSGRAARTLLSEARSRVSRCLDVPARSIVFTRGGTEADNLAVLGRARACPGAPIWHSALEHSAVRRAAEAAGAEGHPVEVLPVAAGGQVTLPPSTPSPAPCVVSVQQVNSETGLELEMPPVRQWCRSRDVVLHIDAVQAPGRRPLPHPDENEALLLSLSAHKMGGPRGIGILVAPEGVELAALHAGGAQEHGLRPGTEDIAGAVGAALALELALEELAEGEGTRLEGLRDQMQAALLKALPDVRVHGGAGARAPHILGLGVVGVDTDVLLGALDLEGICVSAGSACRSGSSGPGPVLLHLLGPAADKAAPLRLSLGSSTTGTEVDEAVRRIVRVVERIRSAGL